MVAPTARATNRTAAPRSVQYSARRESGLARTTSSVPRWRSPATAAAAKPTAKIEFSTSAIGWMDPSAMEPDRLNTSPPPNSISCSGMSPEPMSSRNVSPKLA